MEWFGLGFSVIALDTETHLIGTCPCVQCRAMGGMQFPPMVCMSFANGEHSGVLSAAADNWRALYLDSLARGFVGHHTAYDVGVVWNQDPTLITQSIDAYEADKVTDTILRQKLIDVATGQRKFRTRVDRTGLDPFAAEGPAKKSTYGLATMARDFLGVEVKGKGGVQLRYIEVDGLPVDQWPSEFRDYAAEDAALTLRLFDLQEKAGPNVLGDQYRQARASLWLTLSAAWSVQLDPAGVELLEREAMIERDGLGRQLVEAGLMTWTPKAGFRRSIKAARERQEYAYASSGRETPLTKKGAVSLSRADTEESGDDDLDDYSAFGQVTSVLTKDCVAFRKVLASGGTVHPKIDTVLESGRVSYSGPNLQNMRRRAGARECLKARPGTVYLTADFAGFELATLAQCCLDLVGHSALAEMLNSGIDPHLVIAQQIDPKERAYADLLAHKEDKDVDDLRQTGKVANFGLPGGLGAPTLVHYALQSYGVRLTPELAAIVKAAWLRTFPEMREYFARVNEDTEAGYLIQLRSNRVRGAARYTAGCNSYFQGLAADVAKDAGWRIMREQYDGRHAAGPLYGTRTVLFVHDEYVIETPPVALAAVAKRTSAIMIETGREWLPNVRLGVECKAMYSYSKKPLPGNKVEIPA